jgi:hypothetical protein
MSLRILPEFTEGKYGFIGRSLGGVYVSQCRREVRSFTLLQGNRGVRKMAMMRNCVSRFCGYCYCFVF